MGQSQSSSGGTPAEPEQPLKRDYYELLSVERTATDEEIKKAYRRKALELHPDRNYGNEEGATKLFAEIQAAYEVLSDSQERAWYDSHRDVLLRGETVGGEGGASGESNFAYGSKMTGAEDVLKLMMKFNSRVQFTDGLSGFYGGLDEFFTNLAKEEEIAAQWEEGERKEYPEFGSKDDDYEDIVRPFYAAWNGFATQKSYAWRDKWRLSDAPDRRIRRLMEKDNRKLRDEAIFEFNDAVRSLVAFVRKRDPRVQNNQKSEAERQKALKELAAAQAARSRAQREAEIQSFDLPEWAQSRGQEKDEFEGGFSSEEEEEQHEYECVVCEKVFKSDKQFQTHEKSKKHIKLLKELKRNMKKEGKHLDLEEDVHSDQIRPAEGDDEVKVSQRHKQPKVAPVTTHSDSEDTDAAELDQKRTPSASHVNPASTPDLDSEDSGSNSANSDYAPRTQVEQRLTKDLSDSEPENTAASSTSNITSKLKSSTLSSTTTAADTPTSNLSDDEVSSQQQPKLGKAKQKRAKKAAATTTAGNTSGGGGSEFKCAVCQGDFASKTKLFNHIKEKNHAAPISQMKAGGGGGGGKKGKKR